MHHLFLERPPFVTHLGETGGEDHSGFDTVAGAVRNRVQYPFFVDEKQRQIDRFSDFVKVLIDRVPLDAAALGLTGRYFLRIRRGKVPS